jgi:hypothetical protein
MKILNIITGLLLILLLCSCANLKKKSFRTVISGQGGKMIVSDPASASIFPTFIGGSYYSSITTIPEKTDIKIKTKSYYWWGSVAVEEEIETKHR